MSLNTSDSFGPQPQRGEQLDDSFLVRVNSQEDEHDRLPVADDEKQSARNDGFCDSLRRFCPCEHMQHQLGLLAVDAQDSMRVYLRFVSLVHLVSHARANEEGENQVHELRRLQVMWS